MTATFHQLHDIDGVPATATEPQFVAMNRRAVYFTTWMDLSVTFIEAAHHLHERLGTTAIDTADLWRLKQAINHRDAELDAREWNETINSLLP